jgi:hypothetical protein
MTINTKKIGLRLLLLGCLFSGIVYAQPTGGGGFGNGQMPPLPSPGEVSEEETNWMKKKMKLRADQIPTIEDLNFQYAVTRTQLMQQFMKSGQIPAQSEFEKMKTTMEALQVEKDAALKPLLTDKQWAVYEKKKKRLIQNNEMQHPPMGNGMMPPSSAGGGGFSRHN